MTGLGRVRTPEDIGAVVVAAEDGVPIRVADLGRVQVDAAPKRGEGSVNTQPAVILGVQKQPGTNTLTLTRTLEAVLRDLQDKLPAGMQITRCCGRPILSKPPSRMSSMPCVTAASWSSRLCSSSGQPQSGLYYAHGHSPVPAHGGARPEGVRGDDQYHDPGRDGHCHRGAGR